jgi:hypothetical protein
MQRLLHLAVNATDDNRLSTNSQGMAWTLTTDAGSIGIRASRDRFALEAVLPMTHVN